MAIQVRQAALADSIPVAALLRELGHNADEARIRRRLDRVMRETDHAVFVAIDPPHGLVALLHITVQITLLDRPFAEVTTLVVARNHRRQGVGRQILDHAQWWATRRGLEDVIVRVSSRVSGAQEFLARLNFRTLREQHIYHRNLRAVAADDHTATD